jgi:iron complex outermembrane receptor protein
MALNYSHVKDMFTQLIDTTEKSKAFASKKNLATQDIISLSISYPFQYKTYSLFTSLGSNYSKYEADFGAGRKVNLNAFGLNIFMQHSLKFAKTYTAELSSFYNAPTIYMGSFKGRAMGGVDAGISKQIMKAKATIKASVSDIFYTQKFRATSDFAGQTMKISMRPESRQLKLAFNYRFGNTKVKPARQRSTGAEEETKRVQQGGGVLGG